jgi:hypothetical protein
MKWDGVFMYSGPFLFLYNTLTTKSVSGREVVLLWKWSYS